MMQLEAADAAALTRLLAAYGLALVRVPEGEPIPGSYWGESEAGLAGDTVFARADTPLHSVLHETAHYICMSRERRAQLARDAGGDDEEETAVCYLQVLLGEALPDFAREQQFADMDVWGYSFRLGASARWFVGDAEDARAWLVRHALLDEVGRLTGRRRE